jgi:hypothetical protein
MNFKFLFFLGLILIIGYVLFFSHRKESVKPKEGTIHLGEIIDQNDLKKETQNLYDELIANPKLFK